MREVSVNSIPKLKQEHDQAQVNRALEKVTEGLNVLAQMNIDITQALQDAIANIPKPEPVDLRPLVEAVIQQKEVEPQAYTFVIERNSANMMTKVRAIPE